MCGQSKLFAKDGESVRLPVAHMVCNQTPPVGDKPSLMTFRWVPEWQQRRSQGSRAAACACTDRGSRGSDGCTARQLQAGASCSGCGSAAVTGACAAPLLLFFLHAAPAPPHPLLLALARSEVETLFHEFGHAAQHMLTEQQEGLVAGIRGVEWDAVELPSQFMASLLRGWGRGSPAAYLPACLHCLPALHLAGLGAGRGNFVHL